MKNPSARIPSLDGLRAISIAFVIFGHSLDVSGFGDFVNAGNLGVRVFFVISGFLITGLLLKEIDKNSNIDLLKFYFRRTLRIFPPFYFYLLIIFLAAWQGFINVPMQSFFWAAAYLTDYISPSSWYLGHTWSLAVEEQFYLLFPGILLILGIRRTKYFLIFIVLASPFLRVADYKIFGDEFIWVGKGFHDNMDALAVGCLLSLFYVRLHQNTLYKKFLASKIVFLFPPLILLFNVQFEHPYIFYGVCFSAMNFLIALCIDWTVTNYDSAAGKILNSAPLVTVGMMSYSIYLWQQPFFNPDNPGLLTAFPFNFLGLAAMTLISYYLVEQSSLNLRQKLEKRIFDRKKVAPNTLGYQS